MGSASLKGPYRLSVEGIDLAVRKKSAGVFALGRLDQDGHFCLSRVGRSDKDLNEALRSFIASEALFKFAYESDARRAFIRECELFHRFRPPANVLHPSRPDGTTLICPYCQGQNWLATAKRR